MWHLAQDLEEGRLQFAQQLLVVGLVGGIVFCYVVLCCVVGRGGSIVKIRGGESVD